MDVQTGGRGEQQVGRELRGVHADLDDRARHVRVGSGQPGTEVADALGVDGPPGQGLPELGSADGAVQVAVQREVAVSGAHGGGRGGQRVEQRRGGDVSGPRHADLGPEPGLHPAHLGCLRDDQHGRCHASTRQKSRAARVVPRTEPDTFDRVPRARGW